MHKRQKLSPSCEIASEHKRGSVTAQMDNWEEAGVSPKRTPSGLRRCPSWVNRVFLTLGRRLPLYPDKRTFSRSAVMSQACQERNHASQQKQCCSITSSVPTKGSSLTIYLTELDMHGAMQRAGQTSVGSVLLAMPTDAHAAR